MREYGKVAPTFWIRGSGKALRGNPIAQVVALYLFTGPMVAMSGLFYVPLPTLCYETGLEVAEVKTALARLSSLGIAFYDEDEGLAWVPEMARYQVGESIEKKDKRRLGLEHQVEPFRYHRFYSLFVERYKVAFNLEAGAPSKPLRSQEQEQEQEQDQIHTFAGVPAREAKDEIQAIQDSPVDDDTIDVTPTPAPIPVADAALTGAPGGLLRKLQILAGEGKSFAAQMLEVLNNGSHMTMAQRKTIGTMWDQHNKSEELARGPALSEDAQWIQDRWLEARRRKGLPADVAPERRIVAELEAKLVQATSGAAAAGRQPPTVREAGAFAIKSYIDDRDPKIPDARPLAWLVKRFGENYGLPPMANAGDASDGLLAAYAAGIADGAPGQPWLPPDRLPSTFAEDVKVHSDGRSGAVLDAWLTTNVAQWRRGTNGAYADGWSPAKFVIWLQSGKPVGPTLAGGRPGQSAFKPLPEFNPKFDHVAEMRRLRAI